MKILSVRLKNIKSYGEGANGNGIVISFEPGVNRIAGKNGHGKTTLIESIGFAMFLTNPQFEENFGMGTYLTRSGCGKGEIDVTFQNDGEVYRIERGVGPQTKLKPKVIQIADGSICAEGAKEVSQFLCELLNFPTPDRFSELFAKLIGVRQGRLTWPFDSKPTIAKAFFEPLLEVEIFRRCFEELRPAQQELKSLHQSQEVKLAGVQSRINDRADSREHLKDCDDKKKRLNTNLQEAQKLQKEASDRKEKFEGKEKLIRNSEKERDTANNEFQSSKQRRETAELQQAESRDALETIQQVSPPHELFLEAEEKLKELRKQQKAQRELEDQRNKHENRKTELAATARNTSELADSFAKQIGKKKEDLKKTREESESLGKKLSESDGTFERAKTTVVTLESHREEFTVFLRALPNFLTGRESELARAKPLFDDLESWDKKALDLARKEEIETGRILESVRDSFSKSEERRSALTGQLTQISGGLCPFLKEQCRQFDPAKVEGDLEQIDREVTEKKAQLNAADESHQTAKKHWSELSDQEKTIGLQQKRLDELLTDYRTAVDRMIPDAVIEAAPLLPDLIQDDCPPFPSSPFVPQKIESADSLTDLHDEVASFANSVTDWWNEVQPGIEQRFAAIEEEKSQRQSDEKDLRSLLERDTELQDELAQLADDEKEKRKASEKAESETKDALAQVAKLNEQLKTFAGVSNEIATQETQRDQNRQSHETFLVSKPVADQFNVRNDALETARTNEQNLAEILKEKEAEFEKAKEGFDPVLLEKAKEDCEAKTSGMVRVENDFKHAKEEYKTAETRFDEWEQASKEKDQIKGELGRLRVASEICALARKVLRDSAPTVAQHLCDRIASRAQQIFNRINHDLVELKWNAERYSLRIEPGDRRFAMLSGGEQTKLSLAMTLAMVHEFSALNFCIFDEPTYAVDAESSPLLADAILEAQEAAGLEQLLLVSHDDAFEGKIENTILLKKTSAGSEVISTY